MKSIVSQEPLIFACDDQNFVRVRLDKFLFKHFPDYSRTYFQDLIDLGMVLVNNNPVDKNSYMLKKNDIVSVTLKNREYNLEPAPVDFGIIDVQDDFIVINKPAGLLVHQAHTGDSELTLVNGLLHYFKDLEKFNDPQRPGIIHRIDKDTSGLLIIARNLPAQIALSALFKDRKIQKTYLAIVRNSPDNNHARHLVRDNQENKIDFSIGRDYKERHKMSHKGFASKPALTFYKTLAHYHESALVQARIITGRTHQIRVHFAAIGHPILGDAVYGTKSPLIDRQALHAWKVAFTYKNKNYEYSCPVPRDFLNLFTRIKI